MINKSLAQKFPLEDVLFSGIFRTIANVTNIQHKRGLCEHADRAYEDPAKHLFSGLLNLYFSKDFESHFNNLSHLYQCAHIEPNNW